VLKQSTAGRATLPNLCRWNRKQMNLSVRSTRMLVGAKFSCIVWMTLFQSVEGFHNTFSRQGLPPISRRDLESSSNIEQPPLTQGRFDGFSKNSNAYTQTKTSLFSSTIGSEATKDTFDVDTALFCAGLAFDAYVEPDPDSSRWERGVSIVV